MAPRHTRQQTLEYFRTAQCSQKRTAVVQYSNETHIVNSWLGDLAYQINTPLVLNEYNVCAIGHVSGIDCIVEAPATQGLVLLRVPLLP